VETVVKALTREGITNRDDAVTAETTADMIDALSKEEVEHALEKGKNRAPATFLYDSNEDAYWLM